MKVAILLPNWIGDVVMATPTLRALSNHFAGEAQFVGIMKPYVGKVLEGTPWLQHIEWYDRKSSTKENRTWGLIKRIRRHSPQIFVCLTNSMRAGLIAKLSGARQRVGYARSYRSPLLTTAPKPPRSKGQFEPISAIDYYLELAYQLGCPPESPRMELRTTSADEQIVDQIWHNLDLDRLDRVIAFNTGGAYGAAKHWPTEKYVELAKAVVSEHANDGVLVICGPGEKETAAWIEKEVNHPRVRSMAKQDLSLGVAKATVRRCRLMITTDSGPRHFAPAFGVPVISLFGPIDPRWSDSHFDLAVNLSHPVPCGPCGKRICPLEHHACMRDLSVAQVLNAMRELDQRVTKRVA